MSHRFKIKTLREQNFIQSFVISGDLRDSRFWCDKQWKKPGSNGSQRLHQAKKTFSCTRAINASRKKHNSMLLHRQPIKFTATARRANGKILTLARSKHFKIVALLKFYEMKFSLPFIFVFLSQSDKRFCMHTEMLSCADIRASNNIQFRTKRQNETKRNEAKYYMK